MEQEKNGFWSVCLFVCVWATSAYHPQFSVFWFLYPMKCERKKMKMGCFDEDLWFHILSFRFIYQLSQASASLFKPSFVLSARGSICRFEGLSVPLTHDRCPLSPAYGWDVSLSGTVFLRNCICMCEYATILIFIAYVYIFMRHSWWFMGPFHNETITQFKNFISTMHFSM